MHRKIVNKEDFNQMKKNSNVIIIKYECSGLPFLMYEVYFELINQVTSFFEAINMDLNSISNFLNNSSIAMNWAGCKEFDCNKLPKNIEVIAVDTDTIIFCNNYAEISLKDKNYNLIEKVKYNNDIYIEIKWADNIPVFTPKKYNQKHETDIITYKHFVVQNGQQVHCVSCTFEI